MNNENEQNKREKNVQISLQSEHIKNVNSFVEMIIRLDENTKASQILFAHQKHVWNDRTVKGNPAKHPSS